MWRLCVPLRAAAVVPPALTPLFGTRGRRSRAQTALFRRLKGTSMEAAFPHLAACWVGPCWGTVMLTPRHIPPTSPKMAVWRCSQCLQEFEMCIVKFVNQHGVCPLCNQQQRQVAQVAQAAKKKKEGVAGGEESEVMLEELGYIKAPRMIHSNYRSVLHSNPEWEGRNIQPMLAQKWESAVGQLVDARGEQQELLLASPKIDGIRCLVGYNERRKEPQFFSRGGILLECCHGLLPSLTPLFEEDPSLMLDGELFAPHCNFEELNSLVRRLSKFSTDEIRNKQAQLIEYFAFDIMYSSLLSKPDAPFSERYKLLKKLIPICGAKRISAYQHDAEKRKIIRNKNHQSGNQGVKLYHVPAAQVRAGEMDEVLDEACSQGFEGVMIRRPSFPYEHGKRSFGLLKYKTMHDAEYRIVDVVPGKGKFKGGLGAFICETKNGIRFHATPKTTHEKRISLWSKREKMIGLYLTVQYQELSAQDVPRFPIAKALRGSEDTKDWL